MKKKYKMIIIILTFFLITGLIFIRRNNNYTSVFNNTDLKAYYKGNNANYIAFTCNVDWGTEYIGKMLDIFEKKDIKITFFVSGRWAENNPEVLKQIHDKGHEIGNHGYSHRMHSKICWKENYDEIKSTHDIINNILGIHMNYFAPPAGDFSETTLQVASELGYKTILWNIDTIDWRKDSTSDKIIKRVLSKPLKAGIVLMHPKEETIKSLEYLIESIKEKDINIGRVSDVLK